jgi:hypothetical protein
MPPVLIDQARKVPAALWQKSSQLSSLGAWRRDGGRVGGELGSVLFAVVAVGSVATNESRKNDCQTVFSRLGLAVALAASTTGSSVGTSIVKGGSSLMEKRESWDTWENHRIRSRCLGPGWWECASSPGTTDPVVGGGRDLGRVVRRGTSVILPMRGMRVNWVTMVGGWAIPGCRVQ